MDPLELIEKFGTDALRFTLAIMAAPGTDIALSEDRILSYRAFANKIWNAARFIFVNLEKFQAATGVAIEELAAPEVRAARALRGARRKSRWPTAGYFRASRKPWPRSTTRLRHFRFHEAAHVVYHFFWGDFCDWYIEWVKPALADADRDAALAAWRNLFAIFDAALRLLHPFMPFLTEELWHRLPQRADARSIALEHFPDPPASWRDAEAERAGGAAARNHRRRAQCPRGDEDRPEAARSPRRFPRLTPQSLDPGERNSDAIKRLAILSDLRLSRTTHLTLRPARFVLPRNST